MTKELLELINAFPNEEACIKHLELLRWGGNVVSPFDEDSIVYKCKNGYKCKNTGKYFNVKTNTLFGNSKVGLLFWFPAIMLYTNNPDIKSTELSAELGITQKTAWFLIKRLEKCFHEDKHWQKMFNLELKKLIASI